MAHVSSAEIYSGGDLRLPLSKAKFAMWLFLATEIMFFAGVLGTYIVLRAGNPGVFDSGDLLWKAAAVNTIILITSSLTMALGVAAVKTGDNMKVAGYMAITALFGIAFLGIKFYEYNYKFNLGIYPSSDVFYTCYFVSTGLHGLHVLGGVIMLIVLFLKALASGFPRDSEAVELTGLYWHFVDLVWIYLFPLIYLT